MSFTRRGVVSRTHRSAQCVCCVCVVRAAAVRRSMCGTRACVRSLVVYKRLRHAGSKHTLNAFCAFAFYAHICNMHVAIGIRFVRKRANANQHPEIRCIRYARSMSVLHDPCICIYFRYGFEMGWFYFGFVMS